jgi:hypothetical protein
VLIVDRADRASTGELHRILTDAAARRTKVVLIDGGSYPARREPASPAFRDLRSEIGAIALEVDQPVERVPALAEVIRAGRDDSVALAPTTTATAACLVADWYQARAGPTLAATRAVMVAIGPEEAEHLNRAARACRQAAGELAGPAVRVGRREFQVGDEVRALRRLRGADPGTTGIVTAIDGERQQATIRWPTATVSLRLADLTRSPIGHAYATTPAYMRGRSSPVLAWGDMRRVAPWLEPTAIYGLAPDPPTQARAPTTGPLAHVLAEVGPGRSVISKGGPACRPLSDLITERDAIATRLVITAPHDARPALRRLAEDRAWVEAIPDRADRADRVADLNQRAVDLVAAANRRSAWLAAHHRAMDRWAYLNQAIAGRELALGRAAELRPSRAVVAALGPRPPEEAAARRAWRHAAQAIEAYRDRWGVPDQPLTLDRHRHAGRRTDERADQLAEELADELRVLAACRAAQRARTMGQARDVALASR